MQHTCNIQVPHCWKQLINVEFGDEPVIGPTYKGQPVKKARLHREGNDDPNPYYDDSRTVVGVASNGAHVELQLCSGQSNYWGQLIILSVRGETIYESEPWESIRHIRNTCPGIVEGATVEIPGDESDHYTILVEFV